MLSAEAGVWARIEVLEAGAVDFLAKPFATRELIARFRCRLARQPSAPTGGNAGNEGADSLWSGAVVRI